MRAFLLMTLLLAGCVSQPHEPVPPNVVRINLDTMRPGDHLSAYRLDGELVQGLRFDDIPPGEHELQVRYRYESSARASASGLLGDIQRRSCILAVYYDGFEAGYEYRLVANQLGWSTVGWLEGPGGESLVSARVLRCGPGV
ncbi:hypothetical protein [Pseudomonas sp. OIL-1]|uniref:PA0061/PA0062 family lipoprotein n=1 Tax=Pseudomonas sp. OIL-1 TaxID=2706126 RepID=UPI0013A72F1E|nr:hypothetical protein [Pseudomonas sp. OIL-1]QIB52820.1 hypothetical protein G3M63_18260 [Pseudomonas sp. OIL-1]